MKNFTAILCVLSMIMAVVNIWTGHYGWAALQIVLCIINFFSFKIW